MLIAALLILLAIVCTYSWLAYRIKTSVPKPQPPYQVQVPKPLNPHIGSSLDEFVQSDVSSRRN